MQLVLPSPNTLCPGDSVQATVTVICPVTAGFSLPGTITEGVAATFTNASTNATDFSWTVDGGKRPVRRP